MNLTLEERETSILFDANHKTISVWTLDDAIIRRMTKRHGPPDNSGQAGASKWTVPFTSLDRIVSAVTRMAMSDQERARRASNSPAARAPKPSRIDDLDDEAPKVGQD